MLEFKVKFPESETPKITVVSEERDSSRVSESSKLMKVNVHSERMLMNSSCSESDVVLSKTRVWRVLLLLEVSVIGTAIVHSSPKDESEKMIRMYAVELEESRGIVDIANDTDVHGSADEPQDASAEELVVGVLI